MYGIIYHCFFNLHDCTKKHECFLIKESDARFDVSGQTMSDLVSASVFELSVGNKSINTNFKLYRNSLMFSN